MSRWLIAMSGTVGDTVTGEHEDKTQEEKINSLPGHPNEDKDNEGKDVEVKISFDAKENNPEGKDTSNVPIGISPNGQQQTKDAIA